MKLEIYEIRNPIWLADTFVFGKVDDKICFIKVNYRDKIEELGKDFVERFHNVPFEEIKELEGCKDASVKHRRMFNMFNWREL